MSRLFGFALSLVCLLASSTSSFGQLNKKDETPDNGKGVKLGKPVTQRWKVGAIIRATGGPCRDLFITIPIPTDWNEQTVKVVEEDFSKNLGRVSYRVLDDGVKQMVITVPQIAPGDEAKALLTFEITTHELLAPADTDSLVIPKKPPRNMSKALGSSPLINPRDSKIKKQAAEIFKQNEEEPAWKKVEATFDWVRDNIEYRNGQVTSATQALKDKAGCGEDLVSLFIALVRSQGVPCRTVWVQGHYYPEFYLEDDEGVGHWFPCQVAGNREFGSMSDVRPILQRGDNIRVPEKDDPQRFVPELVKGAAGGGKPQVQFVREVLPAN